MVSAPEEEEEVTTPTGLYFILFIYKGTKCSTISVAIGIGIEIGKENYLSFTKQEQKRVLFNLFDKPKPNDAVFTQQKP